MQTFGARWLGLVEGASDISAVDQNTVGECYPATWHGSLYVRL